MDNPIAIIGGTGLGRLADFRQETEAAPLTPYGEPSAPLLFGWLDETRVVFLARHGRHHAIPPHRINYRANLWALQEAGVQTVIAVAAVGGIRQDMRPGALALPDQIIDYSWGRTATFFEEDLDQVVHIDFTEPYSHRLRQQLLQAAESAGVALLDNGTYGCTQGPRLETAAEILRMERDGCHMVGMTGMPEAALAQELELEYATLAVVANAAAGKGEGPISMGDIEKNLGRGMEQAMKVLKTALPSLRTA